MNWQPFKLQFPLLFVEHINEVKKEKWSLCWSIWCQDIKLLPILFLINLVKSFDKLDIYVRYTPRSVRVCVFVQEFCSELDSEGENVWSYRISITVKYVAEWCRTLEYRIYFKYCLSWKENTNKPVKQNKQYKKQSKFSIKSIMISLDILQRLSIFKIVICRKFWLNVHIILRNAIYNIRQENEKRGIYLYSKDSKAANKDFMYARRRRTIFTSLD